VTAQVGNNQAMPSCKMLDDWPEHLAGDHQSMHEQERRPRSVLSKVDQL
jgi:hypothetical protein